MFLEVIAWNHVNKYVSIMWTFCAVFMRFSVKLPVPTIQYRRQEHACTAIHPTPQMQLFEMLENVFFFVCNKNVFQNKAIDHMTVIQCEMHSFSHIHAVE